jgi:hypothetical protein
VWRPSPAGRTYMERLLLMPSGPPCMLWRRRAPASSSVFLTCSSLRRAKR